MVTTPALLLADTSYTSFFVVWATGHALDLVPELPTLVTYGSDGDAPSAVGDADSYVWIGTDKWGTPLPPPLWSCIPARRLSQSHRAGSCAAPHTHAQLQIDRCWRLQAFEA